MKKALFFAVSLFTLAFTANGQTEEGGIMLGTSTQLLGTGIVSGVESTSTAGIAFASSKDKSDNFESDAYNTTVFNLSPRMGAFVATDFLVGGELTFVYLKGEDDDDPTTSIAVGPFFRYYIPTDNVRPFFQADVSVGQVSFGKDDKANNLKFGLAVGGAFFVNEKVSIDLLVAYRRSQYKEKDSPDNSRLIQGVFGLGAGFSFFL
ncbi:MAG: hypothetical protein J5I98_02435 [Phaeodactylibacter sp.]|nr:hypothetical protein [Phaeodactylibacter sp.]